MELFATKNKSQRLLPFLITTTHIVSYKQMADKINRIINNPLPVENEEFMIVGHLTTSQCRTK